MSWPHLFEGMVDAGYDIQGLLVQECYPMVDWANLIGVRSGLGLLQFYSSRATQGGKRFLLEFVVRHIPSLLQLVLTTCPSVDTMVESPSQYYNLTTDRV